MNHLRETESKQVYGDTKISFDSAIKKTHLNDELAIYSSQKF